MSNQLTQRECINALADGYILENFNTTVYFYKGKQIISSTRNKPYRFTNTNWRIKGRLPLITRIRSAFNKEKTWNTN